MCNFYSITTTQTAIRALVHTSRDRTGSDTMQTTVFPDQVAPVIRLSPDGVREVISMRWGLPSPPTDHTKITTNIDNVSNPWWKPWLQIGHRCLIPATSFCEYDWSSGIAVPVWFAKDEERSPFFFAGIWRSVFCERKGEPGEHLLFSFLAKQRFCASEPSHSKMMPIVLLTEQERETWLTGPLNAALALKRAAALSQLRVVTTGQPSSG